jgi:hypothetical protein
MASGDIVVGKSPSRRIPKTPIAQNLAPRAGASPPAEPVPSRGEQRCGAMSQQRGDSGAVSTPQKFVRLVGCRETKAPRQPR